MNGRFVPEPSRAALTDVNIPNSEDNRMQQQRPGSPRREFAQRFDPPDNNLNRSHLVPTRSIEHVPVRSNEHIPTTTAPSKPPMKQQQQQQQSTPNNSARTDATATSKSQNHRPHTPPNKPAAAGSCSGGKEHDTPNDNKADIVPQSPTPPPPAKPSSYALAMSRMIEMNADMQFAYARLMMLEVEHQRVQARLGALEKLSENNNI